MPRSLCNWFWYKENSKRAVWKYFASEADEHGKLRHMGYKRGCRTALTKATNRAISLAKHLKDQQTDLFEEFREVLVSSLFITIKALNQMNQSTAFDK